MPTRSLQPYRGNQTKLILSIDVGTTYTGVSYAFLQTGKTPEIKTVYGWKDVKKQDANYRVPTVVYYDARGWSRGFGYMDEAEMVMNGSSASSPFYASRWFKLHLCPNDVQLSEEIAQALPPLPTGKTAVDVLGDFLKYVYQYARSYITARIPRGGFRWGYDAIEFVIPHPADWKGQAHTCMRQAAVRGGLVPNMAEAFKRVHFVTEGEANLHYFLYHEMVGFTPKVSDDAKAILIVDAGGGTVDLSTYVIQSLEKPFLAEDILTPQCILEGSTMITRRMEALLRRRFSGSEYGEDENIKEIVLKFDTEDKLWFNADMQWRNIDFRLHSRDDTALGLIKGRPSVSFQEMNQCFLPTLNKISQSVWEQYDASESTIQTVFLMGGLSDNNWLFDELEKRLRADHHRRLYLHRSEFHVCKEVAAGGVAFFLDHFVRC